MVNIHELRKNNYELYKKLLCGNMLTLYQKYGDRLSIEELQEIKKKYISRKYYQGVVNQNKKLKELLQKKNKYTHELEKDLFEGCSNYVVRKDKIREKIKELVNKNVEVLGADRYEYAVRVLQELLEDE